jgi:hypothetical protein
MKQKLFIITAALFFSTHLFGQFSFSVSPGLNLNSANFAYKLGNFVPHIGIQLLNVNIKDLYTEDSYEYDYEYNINLIIPNIGAKYFIKETNSIKAFLSLNLSKPFLTGKYKYNGEVDEDLNELLNRLKLFGGEFGFGAEYFFDEHFSLGGEFGLQYFRVNYEESYGSDSENQLKANISPTYSRITLNYYF